jgi:heme/copper-type cytochrome/quinol oxidase subunit 2
VEFDSYIVPEGDIEAQIFRLLDVDNRAVVPFNTHVRVLISSADVLHAWTVPSLGVKADAVPGRLNQVKFIAQRPGIYFGQCSEICGANHRFIPIVIEAVNTNDFLTWVICFQE